MRAQPGGAQFHPFTAVGVLVALAVAVVACGGGGDGSSSGGDEPTSPAPTEVALEMAGSTGDDPFAEGLAIDETASFPEAVAATISDTAATFAPDPGTGGVQTTGATPGLYGGSQEEAVCDVEALTAFLTDPANTAKADAFTSTLGLTRADLESGFLSALTPVLLVTDTLVTNHGFRDGRATAFPAVLQAGTAVLVDAEGIPRVRCSCGNPLGPAPTEIDLDTTRGDPWPTYTPAATTTVRPAASILTSLEVVDTSTGELVTRPAGAAPPSEPGDLGNILLPAGSCGPSSPPIQLADGSGEASDGPVTYTANVDPEPKMVELDVDRDGSVESVIEVSCSQGNRPFSFVVALRPSADGAPELVGGGAIPEAFIAIESLSVNGEAVAIRSLRLGPDDNLADGPTVSVQSSWLVADGMWRPVS